MNAVELERDQFPSMPAEVFETWISQVASQYGWPVSSELHREAVLAGLTPERIASLSWGRVDIDLQAEQFSSRTIDDLNALEMAVTQHPNRHPLSDQFVNVEEETRRLSGISAYILEKRALPRPLVIWRPVAASSELLDGLHRMLVARALFNSDPHRFGWLKSLPAWVATDA